MTTYHFCAIAQVPTGLAYSDGLVIVERIVDAEGLERVRKHIAEVMKVPSAKINIVSLTLL